ncbi:MAG: Crp/Fnr family transcriptional regulator [Candidatus Binatus sp.]|uniref:Crp/Fnr family transcriptional regulator n=1 Tax=Candidatus Binatus sp. TaxID=2811406 RepID=UPI003C75A15D
MKTKSAQTVLAESKMNQISILNRANVFEAGLFSWGIPEETARELSAHHTEINYAAGKLIFSQGSPADIVMWVVKGVVREVCPNPKGTQTLVRLATAGDVLGLADKLNEKGQWVRRFEAWTASNCVLAIVTRDHVRNLLKAMSAEELLALSERMNSAAAEWVQYYATFLGLSYRERIEMVLAELGRKFGIADGDGVLLTFEPTHSDLAEMIGSSRPVVGRVLTELADDGEIGRRERKYILLRGGTIEAAVNEVAHVANGHAPASIQLAASSRQRSAPLQRQHRWSR